MPASVKATTPPKRRAAPRKKAPRKTAIETVQALGEAPAPAPIEPEVPLLWHSNAPWVGSGYGTQTALFVPEIAKRGYRCAFSAFYGLKGSRLGWVSKSGQRFVVYPGGVNSHGNDVLGAHTKHWFGPEGGGLVVSLTDPWVLAPPIVAKLPLLAWTPVDHAPLMPRTHEWFINGQALPVAMSRFGERMIREAGHETVFYVPHGFDPAVFRPADRVEARVALGIPKDAFVVGMVAANLGIPSRKSFAQAIAAFSRFQETHPDALLYLHTKLENPDGEDLPRLCKSYKVKAMTSDQYGLALGAPESLVAALMSAFDVLLNPSTGEGFGVPLLEAQACGTPCITTDFSAMPEVAPVSAGNWCVGGQEVWTPFESKQMTPSIDEIVDSLERAYADSEEERLARRVSVYQHAMANYQAKDITEKYWIPTLKAASIEFGWRGQLLQPV